MSRGLDKHLELIDIVISEETQPMLFSFKRYMREDVGTYKYIAKWEVPLDEIEQNGLITDYIETLGLIDDDTNTI